ncbi:hypothetical protein E4U35_003604 [Claviceps purpurea]|nr:hypothetical protein E4U51_002166 [Claviceps purpurea]KAG6196738.1 hypothetical protein E4U10_000734 [Claviceps purpurea]KAG6212594.1 hypothetical protein E4U35_003604 [Claviceps purpurea]KAG6238222.1 hypothetical protein E4U25_001879 [Claviceps purpurea]KAG6242828.1 hypothetical protein E4U23_006751 [Claviceps purpurea]
MVQILPLFLATLATISPVVQAGSCTPGLDYCGRTLTGNGWASQGLHPSYLYYCVADGAVNLKQECRFPGCKDGGTGNSDVCLNG